MIIKKACAAFGNLDNQTLEFNSNLNLFYMENETGKSTWCAFLRVMLFGIDTRDRDRAPTKDNPLGYIADKNKYAPWNGKPMSGQLIVEHDGREIEILRSNSRGGAMQNFSARYTDTLEPVPGLTSSNCGEILCGVCAEAYEKSAFISSGSVICAGESAELESKINSLVTSGNENNAASVIEQRLNKFKNNIRSNSANGLLPRAAENLTQTENKISVIRRLAERETALCSEITESNEKIRQIDKKLDIIRAYDVWQNMNELSAAKKAFDLSGKDLASAEQQILANGKPLSEEFICAAREKLTLAHASEKELAELKENCAEQEKQFCNYTAELAEAKSAPPPVKKASKLPFIAAAFFVVLSCVLIAFSPNIAFVSALITLFWICFSAGCIIAAKRVNKKNLDDYNSSKAELEKKQAQYEIIKLEHDKRQADFAVCRSKNADALFALIELLSPFCPGISSTVQAEEFLNAAQSKISALTKAKYEYKSAEEKFLSLSKNAENSQEISKPECPAPLEPREALTSEKARLSELIRSLEKQRFALKGEMSATGDLTVLLAQKEQYAALIGSLQKKYDALLLADSTLHQVSAEISAKISAPVSQKAEQFLSRLTNGKYIKFELSDKFRAACGESNSERCISAEKLSSGAADALYLSLRLSVCELVLNDKNPPLVLDDALLTFDNTRTKLALDLLAELSQHRQIIFFSCKPFAE